MLQDSVLYHKLRLTCDSEEKVRVSFVAQTGLRLTLHLRLASAASEYWDFGMNHHNS